MSTKYNIYRNNSLIAKVEAKTYTDNDVEPNTSYTYRVSTVEHEEESALSAPITVLTDYSPPSEVVVTPSTINIKVGESEIATAAILPSTARQDIVWTNSDSEVAEVSEAGEIQGLAPGNATITASASDDDGVSGSVLVTVTQPVTGITLNEDSISIEVGDSEELIASVEPSNASNKEVVWSTSDDEICTVDDGIVTAVAEGEATITVTTDDGEMSASCLITVTNTESEPEEDE